MICLIGFLSISVLNVGTIILLIGQVVVVPVITFILQIFTSVLPGTHVPPSDVGLLVPSVREALAVSKFNVAPSYWVSHTVFLCSYIFMNAYTVYTLNTSAVNAPAWKTGNRKGRSLMIMIVSVLCLLTLLISRYRMTGTETIFGILIGLGAFIPVAYYWYQIAITKDEIIRTDPYIFFTTREVGKTIAYATEKKEVCRRTQVCCKERGCYLA